MQTLLFTRIIAAILAAITLPAKAIEAALEAALTGATLLNQTILRLQEKFGNHPDLEDVAVALVDFAQAYPVPVSQLTPGDRAKLSLLFQRIYSNPDPETEALIESLFEQVLEQISTLSALNTQLAAVLPTDPPADPAEDPEPPAEPDPEG